MEPGDPVETEETEEVLKHVETQPLVNVRFGWVTWMSQEVSKRLVSGL